MPASPPRAGAGSEVRIGREDVVDFASAVVLEQAERPNAAGLRLGNLHNEPKRLKSCANRRITPAEIARTKRPSVRVLVPMRRAGDCLRVV